MREREAAALVSACMLFSVAALRMLAPALPFDWMTLTLLLVAAALAVALPGFSPPRRRGGPPPHRPDPAHGAPPDGGAIEALRARMAGCNWQAGDGGLFESLRTLRESNPFAALCAARGLLMMLAADAHPQPEDAATLSLLTSTLDGLAAAGEDAADPHAIGDLFDFTLRALGRFHAR